MPSNCCRGEKLEFCNQSCSQKPKRRIWVLEGHCCRLQHPKVEGKGQHKPISPRVQGNAARACACANGQPTLARLQVRSRFRPAVPGRKLQSARMRFPALLLGRERRPKASGDPAPPSQRGTNCTAVGGIFEKAARPCASRGVYQLVGAEGAGARFPLGVGGARAAKASTEAAGERAHEPRLLPGSSARARAGSRGRWPGARLRRLSPLLRLLLLLSVSAAAEAGREGVASPPAAPPVRPLVPPREDPVERSSAQKPELRPPLCRCL